MNLTFRTCSNCAHWRVNTTVENGVVKALCLVHDERKSGGDKCSAWAVKVPGTVVGSEWDGMF